MLDSPVSVSDNHPLTDEVIASPGVGGESFCRVRARWTSIPADGGQQTFRVRGSMWWGSVFHAAPAHTYRHG